MTKAEPQLAPARPELSAPMLAVWSVVAASPMPRGTWATPG